MGTELSDRFFGGTSNVRIKLVDALRQARERKRLKPEEVDARCHLGINGTVKCRDYEANPQAITPFTFSLVSSQVGVTLDGALPVTLSQKDTSYVIRNMKKQKTYLAGVNAGDEITREDASIYLVFKIWKEIGQSTTKRGVAA